MSDFMMSPTAVLYPAAAETIARMLEAGFDEATVEKVIRKRNGVPADRAAAPASPLDTPLASPISAESGPAPEPVVPFDPNATVAPAGPNGESFAAAPVRTPIPIGDGAGAAGPAAAAAAPPPMPAASAAPVASSSLFSENIGDPYELLMQAGLGMMQAGAQPGASLFGAIGAGGASALQGLGRRRERAEDREYRDRRDAREQARFEAMMAKDAKGYRTLTDEEEAERGLDTSGVYQEGPQGQVAAVYTPPKSSLLTPEEEAQRIRLAQAGRSPSTPAVVQEYEYAKANGFQGNYRDFVAFKAQVGGGQEQDPAAVQEFRFWQGLPPDQQREYLAVKRAQQFLDQGDRRIMPDPMNPGQTLAQFPKGIAPERKIDDGRVVTLPGVPGEAFPQTPMPQQGIPQAPGGGGMVSAPATGLGAAPAAPQSAPGGPMVQELPPTREEIEKRAQQQALADIKVEVVTQDIDRALDMLDSDTLLPMTGAVGDLIGNVGGTAQGDLRATLDTVKANIGFDQLQKMREASPTGGALGAVSEMENRLLQSVLGNLEQSQSREQLEFNLQRLRDLTTRVVHRGIPADEARQLIAQAQGAPAEDPEMNDLLNKYAPE